MIGLEPTPPLITKGYTTSHKPATAQQFAILYNKMQQEIRHFFKLGATGLFLKSFVWCGHFVIFWALFWTKKSFEKAFFFMRRRNQTPCPCQGQNVFYAGGGI